MGGREQAAEDRGDEGGEEEEEGIKVRSNYHWLSLIFVSSSVLSRYFGESIEMTQIFPMEKPDILGLNQLYNCFSIVVPPFDW